MFAVKIVVLIGLIRLLPSIGPITAAGIYVTIAFIGNLLFGADIMPLIIGTVIAFGLAFVYFWLLHMTEETMLWWVVLIGGLFIGFV